MSALSKVKKGGVARWVINGVQQNDTFTVPRGFRIRYMAAEPLITAAAGTNQIAVGTAIGVFPVQTLTGNGVAVGGSGTTVTIDGIAVTVAQLDTSAVVLDKIMAAYTAGSFTNAATTSLESWTMVRTSPTVITITGNCPKTVAGVSIAVGSITGFTLTAAQVTAGSVSATVVNATTMQNYAIDYPGQAYSGYTALTLQTSFDVCSPSHSPHTYVTFASYTGALTGSFSVNGVSYTPTQTAASVTGQATGVRDIINASSNQTGISAMLGAAGVVVITNFRPFYGTASASAPTVVVSGLTGATVTKASVDLDRTYYVSLSGQAAKSLEGNVNLYVLLEKLG